MTPNTYTGVTWGLGLFLGPPPAGIWAGGISISSQRGTSKATTTGSDPDRCSELLASLSLEYVIGLGKMVVFMAQTVGNLRLVSFWELFSSGGSRR